MMQRVVWLSARWKQMQRARPPKPQLHGNIVQKYIACKYAIIQQVLYNSEVIFYA